MSDTTPLGSVRFWSPLTSRRIDLEFTHAQLAFAPQQGLVVNCEQGYRCPLNADGGFALAAAIRFPLATMRTVEDVATIGALSGRLRGVTYVLLAYADRGAPPTAMGTFRDTPNWPHRTLGAHLVTPDAGHLRALARPLQSALTKAHGAYRLGDLQPG